MNEEKKRCTMHTAHSFKTEQILMVLFQMKDAVGCFNGTHLAIYHLAANYYYQMVITI